MVLRELISLWNDESAMKEMFHRFDEMMTTAKEMFRMSTAPLAGESAGNEVGRDIVKMDARINTLQQVIRRDIVTHISVQGTADIVPCLMLMSLIKDAERIGDYCKNVHEVIAKAPQLMNDPLKPDLVDMRSKIIIWFDQTKRAFDRSDKDLARTTSDETYPVEKNCDKQVWDLAANNRGRNAVAVSLMFRFYKRIIAHLSNIATSVILPLDKLDFFDEGTMGPDKG